MHSDAIVDRRQYTNFERKVPECLFWYNENTNNLAQAVCLDTIGINSSFESKPRGIFGH